MEIKAPIGRTIWPSMDHALNKIGGSLVIAPLGEYFSFGTELQAGQA
jgi:hypothetical protein